MDLKPKQLLRRAAALLVAGATSISLAVSAFADSFYGVNYGVTATLGSSSGYMYETNTTNSWKVTLYVATTDDGKIDPTTANITTEYQLSKVGTVVYDNDAHAANDVVLYPADVTDIKRSTAITYLAGKSISSTGISQVISTDWYIPGSDVRSPNTDIVHGVTGDYIYRRSGAEVSKWLPAYGAYADAANNDNEFTQTVIEQMNLCLGGTESNFIPLYTKIAYHIGKEPKEKLAESKKQNGFTDYKLLLPQTEGCVVEWCCVIEAMPEIQINVSTSKYGFWSLLLRDSWGDFWIYHAAPAFMCGTGGNLHLYMDAYSFATYNEYSKQYYGYNSAIKDIAKVLTDFLSYRRLDSWKSSGALRTELGTNFCNTTVAKRALVHQTSQYYCGVPSYDANQQAFDIVNYPGYFAAYGGIGVLLSKLEDDETDIPVYYYIYDENNKFVELKQETYTPDGNGFIPSADYGIPIADESLNNSDQPIKSTTGGTRYFYYKDYPSLACYVIDFKGTSAGENLLNPSAVTDAIKTSKTVSGITTEAKSIHVKIIKAPSVDIYYHTYTYTVPDECWDEVNNALQGLEGLEYEKKLEELAKQYGFADKYTVTVTKREMPLV